MSIQVLSGNNLKDQSATSNDTAVQLAEYAPKYSLQNFQVGREGKHL